MRNKNVRYFISIFLFSLIFLSIILPINNSNIPTVYAGSGIYQIAHTNNDAHEYGDGTFSTTPQLLDTRTDAVTDSADYKCSGYMFIVPIPQGATITGANISVKTDSSSYASIDAWIYAHDVDDSQDFVDNADIIDDRVRTTATVNWDEDTIGELTWGFSPDLTEVIQEIVDRGGWKSGNNLTILFIAEDESTLKWFKCNDYSKSSVNSAKLYVDWDDPPNIIYPDHVESDYGVTNSSDTLDNDDVYATCNFDALITWDFGGGFSGNVTAIRWELVYPTTAGLWRLEGSEDKSSWEIIAQMGASKVGSPPTNLNDSTRYDGKIFTPFRYLRLFAIKSVLNDYFIDYICYIVEPPTINYSYSTYFYPNYFESWNWKINGMTAGDSNYASRPYNLLGQNQSYDSYNASAQCLLVNADFDADNMALVRFDNFYNITSCEVLVNVIPTNQHAYLYVSSYIDRGWELVWQHTGNLLYDWYGDLSFNATYIRFAKLNGTGTGTNVFKIGGFRIQGELYGAGTPPANGNGNGLFVFPPFVDLPDAFADVLGISPFSAGILLSGIFLMMFLLPIVWYGKSSLAVMMVGLVNIGFLVTIGWLPTWIILIIILLIAGMYASKIADWLSPASRQK
ncbi:hypothetical protein ES702_03933 [subsurface metagenome]